ncbi:MAG TPA: M56 family metallopeptidase [Gemmatimonadales bacterium]
MIAAWMLYGTVVAALVGVGALALERGARLIGRAGRWCWVGAMIVSLALPVAAWLRPRVLQPVPITLQAADGTLEAAPPVILTAPSIRYRSGHTWSWGDLNRPLAAGWALVSFAMLAWFALASRRLARMRKSWRAGGGFLISDNVGPAVVGFLRCEVVVPAWSLGLSPEQRALLLAHEAEHVAAHDSRLLLVSAAMLALVPWNAGLWWQFSRLRLAIELDCDDRVLRAHPDRVRYGRLLLDVGAKAARTLLPVTAFHEPTSSLERRIRSMTSIRPKRAGLIAGMMALAAVISTVIACEAPRPTAPGRQDAAAAKLSPDVDSLTLLPWVRDGLQKAWSNLLAEKSGEPVEVWFFADSAHRVLGSQARPAMTEHGQPSLAQVQEAMGAGPGSGSVRAIAIGGAHGWARSNVSVIWVTLRDTSGLHEIQERLTRAMAAAEHAEPSVTERRREEAARSSAEEEIRARLREAVAKYYPRYLTQRADPPVVLWFSEGTGNGVLRHEQTLRTSGEGVGPVPQDLGGAGLFKGWLTVGAISEHRTDVTLVWVHPGQPE